MTNYLKAYNAPLVIWCYFSESQSKIINAKIRDNSHLNVHTPHTLMTVHRTDISAICDFWWYDWFYYRYPGAKFSSSVKHLGIVLGQVDHPSTSMSQWDMNDYGAFLTRHKLRFLHVSDISSGVEEQKYKDFDAKIQSNLGVSLSLLPSTWLRSRKVTQMTQTGKNQLFLKLITLITMMNTSVMKCFWPRMVNMCSHLRPSATQRVIQETRLVSIILTQSLIRVCTKLFLQIFCCRGMQRKLFLRTFTWMLMLNDTSIS